MPLTRYHNEKSRHKKTNKKAKIYDFLPFFIYSDKNHFDNILKLKKIMIYCDPKMYMYG